MTRITRIVCPVDFSLYSEMALLLAARLGAWYRCGVTAMHVTVPLPSSEVAALAQPNRALIERNLEAMVARARPTHPDVDARLIEGDTAAAAIVKHATATNADLLVMGSHGRSGFDRFVLGSVTDATVRSAPCPVLVVPSHLEAGAAPRQANFTRILCTVDFSVASLNALAEAMTMAEETNGELTLLSVIETPPELQQRSRGKEINVDAARAEAEAEELQRLRALIPDDIRAYCTVRTAIAEGGAARQILREAEQRGVDLIVMGVHGRSRFDELIFGSTTQDVLRKAHCPVLVVRSGRPALSKAS